MSEESELLIPTTSEDQTVLITEQSEEKPPISDIVQRYLHGESVQDLAKESGLNVRTLYRWMMTECGDQYQSLVTQVLADRIADADQMLLNASDSCQVARAREIARFARMDFERRRPKLYGPQSAQAVDNRVMVVIER